MISLEEYRKRNPYDRNNTIGQSVFAWREKTYTEWRADILNSARNIIDGKEDNYYTVLKMLIDVLEAKP